ncbi:MAG TPA: amino acid permease [Steroidobacteraceae bacterium]|nr:amino acid permease [Steroidobacteraceae bacterium]
MNDTAATVSATTAAADDHSLSRSLRPRHVSMITIGGIIGAGLFVGSSAAISAAGPASVISYALTGAVVFLIMRMLGEMAVANPQVRSFTEFSRLGLGHWAGFSVGWLYWFFWVVVIPVEAIAGATILQDWLPLENWQLGAILMAAMTGVNLMSARAYGEFEFWFSSIKVAAIITFIAMAASYAFGLSSPSGPTFGNLVSHGGFMPHGPVAVLATVTTVIFSMMGAEIVAVAAAESTEPARAVARMSSTIVVRILVFYVTSLLLIVSILPWDRVRPGESPFTRALEQMHVPWAPTIMSAIILTAVLSCLNSAFYVASRVLFVLADKGDAPHWLVKTNKRHVPARSVMLGSAVGFAGVLVAVLSPSVVFKWLVNASGAVIVFVYIATAAAQVSLRRRGERAGGPPPALPIWLFPWLSYFAIAAMTAVLVAMAFTPDLASQLWASVGSVAVALVAYALVRHGKYEAAP